MKKNFTLIKFQSLVFNKLLRIFEGYTTTIWKTVQPFFLSDFNFSQNWPIDNEEQECQSRGLVNDYGTSSTEPKKQKFHKLAFNISGHSFSWETVSHLQLGKNQKDAVSEGMLLTVKKNGQSKKPSEKEKKKEEEEEEEEGSVT